jgi:putative salt-induced outer membrane protein YdiY
MRRIVAAHTIAGSLLILPALSQNAAAQIRPISIPPTPAPLVVSEPPRLEEGSPEAPDPWSGKAEVSYVSTGGNAETITAKVGAEAQYRAGEWATLLRAAFLTNTTEASDRNRRVDALVRSSRRVGPRLEVFGQIAYLKNTFAGIRDSVYPLGGIAYAVIDTRPHSLTTRFGLGYGQESRLRTVSVNSFATADAETAYRWGMTKTTELRQDTSFTSNLSQSADWRMANVTSLAAGLNALLSLKVSHTLNYLNQPVEGFERVDTVTAAALVATF